MSQAEAQLEETHLGRRRFLQLAGVSAAVAGGATASDDVGLVGDAAADMPDLAYTLESASPVGWAAGSAAADLANDLFSSPDNNETALHQAATTAAEWYDSHHVVVDNYLEDTPTIASTEARDALAETWENGGSASEAAGAAVDEIYAYYDQRLKNHIEIGRGVLTQLALQSETARNSGEFFDGFVTVSGAVGTYSGSGSIDTSYLAGGDTEEEQAETTITLTNGEEYTTTMPEFVVQWDNGDELRTPIDDEWIDNYDAQAGTTTLATADGNEFTGDLGVNIANVPESDLPSRGVFEPVADFVDVIHRIRDQASTVAGNYDLSFVEDLYAELNAGTITPQDVRGVEGIARFMSGTDDVHSSRFQMALAAQLGLEQPDLSNTASMSIEYTGATGYSVSNPEDGPRGRHPAEFVEDETYTGMLFAGNTPSMITGGRYALGPTVYSAGDGEIHATDAANGEQEWTYSGHSENVNDVTTSPIGATVISASESGEIHATDAANGEREWTYSGHGSSAVQAITVAPDGATVFSGDFDGAIHAIDAASGEQQWTSTGYSIGINDVTVSPDGSTIYSADDNGEIHATATGGGDHQWTYSVHGSAANGLAISTDGTTIYSAGGDSEVFATNVDNGDQQWTYSGHSETVNDVTVSPDGETIYSGSNGNEVHATATESGDQQWTYSGHDGSSVSVTVSPDGSTVFSGSLTPETHAIDTESGDQQWTYSGNDGSSVSVTVSPDGSADVDGTVTEAYFFAGESGDELQLSNGVMEVTSMEGSDGTAVTVADGDTITYIEDADGRTIEEILAEIPEIDGVDDVTSLSDLELIVEEADGVDSVDELPIDVQEWEEPEYDSYNADDYVEYINKITEDYQNALENDDGGGGGGGVNIGWPDLGGSGLVSSLISVVVIIAVIVFGYNIVSDDS